MVCTLRWVTVGDRRFGHQRSPLHTTGQLDLDVEEPHAEGSVLRLHV
jgi:hypothetical protein